MSDLRGPGSGVHELDDTTADRLLDGRVAAADAPQGYQDVALALQAATLAATSAPTHRGDAAVAAFLDAIPTRRTARMKKWKIAAAALAGGLTLSTGLAAADVLPGAAQDVASEALAKVGISVPANHNDKADKRGASAEHKADNGKPEDKEAPPSSPKAENHGSVVSNVAGDKTTEGADHGSAVCATASAGKCQPDNSKPAAPAAKTGQGSTNSTEGSVNSTQGSTNSGEGSVDSGTTSTGGSSSGSSNSSTGGSSSSSGSSSNSSGSSSSGG